MADYYGRVVDGRIVHVTDDCACYDDNFDCYCAECYHCGPEYVNCQDAAFHHADLDDYKPVKWNGHQWTLDD